MAPERSLFLESFSVFSAFGIEPRQHVTFDECRRLYRRASQIVYPDVFPRRYAGLRDSLSADHPMHRFPYEDLIRQLNEAWEWLQEDDFTERWRLVWNEELDDFASLWNLDGSGAAVYAPKPGFPVASSAFYDDTFLPSASPASLCHFSGSGICSPRSASLSLVGRFSTATADPQEQGMSTPYCSGHPEADAS